MTFYDVSYNKSAISFVTIKQDFSNESCMIKRDVVSLKRYENNKNQQLALLSPMISFKCVAILNCFCCTVCTRVWLVDHRLE